MSSFCGEKQPQDSFKNCLSSVSSNTRKTSQEEATQSQLLKYHILPPNVRPARCVLAESAGGKRLMLLVIGQTIWCQQQPLHKLPTMCRAKTWKTLYGEAIHRQSQEVVPPDVEPARRAPAERLVPTLLDLRSERCRGRVSCAACHSLSWYCVKIR